MRRGPTRTDRRTLSVATGNYAAGRSAGYENQALGLSLQTSQVPIQERTEKVKCLILIATHYIK